MNQDTTLTTLVAIKAGPVIRIRRRDQADAARKRIASAAGSRMLGTTCRQPHPMQTPQFMQTPQIGAVFISLGVSEPELARIDVDAGARAEDLRERLAQYARKSAPGLMAHECAHESRVAR